MAFPRMSQSSIGLQLRQAREARTLTIDQAATSTRIRAHYLRAIELGEFENLPSPVHARGFLRAYADFLGMDTEKLVSELDGKGPPKDETPASLPEQAAAGPNLLAPEEAGAIFVDVGQKLVRQRELLGLSLEDVERHTHLRQHYLRALEAGNLDGLPSPVQGRGMLDNYASFLGLDSDNLLLRFAEGLQAQLQARRAQMQSHGAQPQHASSPESPRPILPARLRRLLSPDILIGGTLAVFLLAFVFWGGIRIFSMTSEILPTATAPSIAEVLLATSTPTETPTIQPVTPTAPAQPQLFPTLALPTGTLEEGAVPPEGGGPAVQVYLTIRQRAWVRVIVDGEVEFEGRVLPGSAYPFIGGSQVEVLTGNGAALQVFFNGDDLGLMGDIGEIVDQVFTPQGVFAPTATISPTPTATAPISTPAAGTQTLQPSTPLEPTAPPSNTPAAP